MLQAIKGACDLQPVGGRSRAERSEARGSERKRPVIVGVRSAGMIDPQATIADLPRSVFMFTRVTHSRP